MEFTPDEKKLIIRDLEHRSKGTEWVLKNKENKEDLVDYLENCQDLRANIIEKLSPQKNNAPVKRDSNGEIPF